MDKEKFIELIKETIEIEEDIKFIDKFREYEEWDSLAVLSMLAMINEEFDIDVWYEESMTIIGKMFEPFPKFAEQVTS